MNKHASRQVFIPVQPEAAAFRRQAGSVFGLCKQEPTCPQREMKCHKQNDNIFLAVQAAALTQLASNTYASSEGHRSEKRVIHRHLFSFTIPKFAKCTQPHPHSVYLEAIKALPTANRRACTSKRVIARACRTNQESNTLFRW